MAELLTSEMRLSELLCGAASIPTSAERLITGLAIDSRDAAPGVLFIALAGAREHGIVHALAAVARGAAAVLCDDSVIVPEGLAVPVVRVAAPECLVGVMAARLYAEPSRRLSVWGVTGTNGKTSVSQFLAKLSCAVGRKCGVLGTIGYGFPGELSPATHTTPDAIRVHRWLAQFAAAGATSAAMEVSSHALVQHRVAGVQFTGAVFTNLTRDHLDYHGTFEAYGEAKRSLFLCNGLRYAVINVDDAFGRELSARLPASVDVLRVSLTDASVEIYAAELVANDQGLSGVIQTPKGAVNFRTSLMGSFQASNIMAAVACLIAEGVAPAQIGAAISTLSSVPGRMEVFAVNGVAVVVDYAHTPDALATVLNALRPHCRGQLRVVFGCGGDRDRGKRPMMGEIATRLADEVIVTTDNPRSESPEQIAADVLSSIPAQSKVRVSLIREQAIRATVAASHRGDVVLVAGKGHEDYQEIRGVRHPYSDIALVQQLASGGAA